MHRGAMEPHDPARDDDPIEAALVSEASSIQAAVELVASGRVPSVTLAGLRLVDALLPEVERFAKARHVRVRPVWPMGDGPVDLVIEAQRRDG